MPSGEGAQERNELVRADALGGLTHVPPAPLRCLVGAVEQSGSLCASEQQDLQAEVREEVGKVAFPNGCYCPCHALVVNDDRILLIGRDL